MSLKFSLVSDGSSDKALIYVLAWLCRERFNKPMKGEWFEPRLFAPPLLSLRDRILKCLELQACDILFVHRDAEGDDPQKRYDEINEAAAYLLENGGRPPLICVVPVRMTEAWLLFDEAAIRRAAANPNGTNDLNLPKIRSLESLRNPKELLFEAFRSASGLRGRKLRKLRVNQCRLRVAELIRDFSPLRALKAFQRLEADIQKLTLD